MTNVTERLLWTITLRRILRKDLVQVSVPTGMRF
jgi:hypothetical protein